MLLKASGRTTCRHRARATTPSSCLLTWRVPSALLPSSALQATLRNFSSQAPSTCLECSSLSLVKTPPLSSAIRSSTLWKFHRRRPRSTKRCAARSAKSSSEAAPQAAQLCSQTQRLAQSTRTPSTEGANQRLQACNNEIRFFVWSCFRSDEL
jgi:hypothetical protein